MTRFFLSGPAVAVVLAGCQQQQVADVTRFIKPSVLNTSETAAPPNADPALCWGHEPGLR